MYFLKVHVLVASSSVNYLSIQAQTKFCWTHLHLLCSFYKKDLTRVWYCHFLADNRPTGAFNVWLSYVEILQNPTMAISELPTSTNLMYKSCLILSFLALELGQGSPNSFNTAIRWSSDIVWFSSVIVSAARLSLYRIFNLKSNYECWMVLSWRVKSSGGMLFKVNIVHKSIGHTCTPMGGHIWIHAAFTREQLN